MPAATNKLQRRTVPAGTLTTRVMPESWDESTREIDLLISTGAAGKRWAWGVGEYIEELDVAGCNLERLAMAGPVLLDHDPCVEKTAGRVVEAYTTEEGVKVRAKLASREEMAGIVQDIVGGVIASVSVGYSVEREEVIKEEGQLERRIAREWTPWEVSFVAIPFDAAAGTRAAAEPLQRQESPMSEQTTIRPRPLRLWTLPLSALPSRSAKSRCAPPRPSWGLLRPTCRP